MFGRKKPTAKPRPLHVLRDEFTRKLDALLADYQEIGDRDRAATLEGRAQALRNRIVMNSPI